MALPVTYVDQTVVVERHTMQHGHERVAGFGLRAVQIPLAQELSGAIKHHDAVVSPGSLAVGNVNVAILRIDRDARGFKERRVAGVQSFSLRRAIGRVDYPLFPDLEQELASI